MRDISRQVKQLRDIARALEEQQALTEDPLSVHPETQGLLNSRHTKRGQFNYAVPIDLALQRRVRQYHADHEVPHGDIVAMALDAWLRAKGYPPPKRTSTK
ncbi:hypothetical protein K7472_20580 [Streptomyces sp. PTM05]|uniref:CopG family transcriptional regulator n=1 Tax=Streptantibioticus parmotrematis TaxID=2873249 RepID=A0ABS7QVK3_9ACTN|nr:hypothetical protein [Streptantibioticus parmotrematis]MBY8887225.1 hypothetical protein [Streptantibioticus parmotrematis]